MELFVYLSCLLPELSPLKCQKWLILFFSPDNRKNLVTVWEISLRTPGRSYRVLAENGMFNRLWT